MKEQEWTYLQAVVMGVAGLLILGFSMMLVFTSSVP